MKTILALIISLNTYASLPLTTLSGQSATTKPTTFNFKTPYSQSTSLGGPNSLIETGNENMLVNPSFEGPTILPWTCAVGTCTVETTVFSSGKQALKIVPAANIFTLNQEITTPANIQKQGAIGVIYNFPATCLVARVQTSIDGVLANTVSGSSLIYDGQFHTIEIPTVFGSSLAAISVNTDTGTCTGNIYIDAAYIKQGLGLTNLFQDAEYRAKVSSTGVVSDEDRDFISGNCTNAYPSVCTFVTGIFTVAPNCTALINGGANRVMTTSTIPTASSVSVYWMDSNVGTANAQPFTLSCKKSGNDYLASSTQVYQSTNGNFALKNVGTITIQATITNPTKGTIAVDQVLASRYGDRLVARYQYRQTTNGTGGNGDYLFSLPVVDGVQLAFNSNIKVFTGAMFTTNMDMSQSIVGTGMATNSTFVSNCTLYAYSTTQFRAFCLNTGTNGGAINGYLIDATNFSLSGGVNESYGFNVDAPVSSWTNSNVIVGSFDGIEKCANNYECTDTFSAKVSSACVVSGENVDWINGNGVLSATSTCTFTLNTNLKDGVSSLSDALSCSANVNADQATTLYGVNIPTSTTSSVVTAIHNDAGAVVAQPIFLSCGKSTNDYKPKTAKVASSIGVPTVPGITTEAIDTGTITYGATASTVCATASTNCAYLDQIGGMFNATSGVVRGASAGLYTVNFNTTYSKAKCWGSADSPGSSAGTMSPASCASCSSLTFETTTTNTITNGDTRGVVNCMGSR